MFFSSLLKAFCFYYILSLWVVYSTAVALPILLMFFRFLCSILAGQVTCCLLCESVLYWTDLLTLWGLLVGWLCASYSISSVCIYNQACFSWRNLVPHHPVYPLVDLSILFASQLPCLVCYCHWISLNLRYIYETSKAGFDEILRKIRLKPESMFLIKKCVYSANGAPLLFDFSWKTTNAVS